MCNIKYLIMDVDGTLTDGKVYMSSSGEAVKAFNIKDGYGICNILASANIIPIIITGRKSEILNLRCKELNISEVYQGVNDKLNKIKTLIADLSMVAYIGDDLNDIESMSEIKSKGGIIGCPADAAKQVKSLADFVSVYRGGEGAVREFIEYLYMKIKNGEE